MANYINTILKKGSFSSNGNEFAFVVSDANNTIWVKLADICNAIGIKYWCVPSSPDCVLTKPFTANVRKVMFSKAYATGIKDDDLMDMLRYYASEDSNRGEKANNIKKVVKNFLYREKKKIDEVESEQNFDGSCGLSTINNTSDATMLKEYFIKVKEFANSEEKFPIDLDEIWGLSFTTKSNAIKFIKKEFLQNVDYQTEIQNISAKVGSSRCHKYMLSVPCMEFIIAKANRYVFEIYRKVFHEVTNSDLALKVNYGNFQVPQKFSEALALAAQLQQTVEEQELKLKEKDEQICINAPKVEYYDDMVEGREYFTSTTIATELRTTPSALNKFLCKYGVLTGKPCSYKVNNGYTNLEVEKPYPSYPIRWNKEGRDFIHSIWREEKQQ